MHPRRRLVPIGALVGVLAGSLAACQSAPKASGGGIPAAPSTTPVADIVRQTLTRADAVTSFSADLDEQGTADGRNTTVTAAFRYRKNPDPAVSADFTQLDMGGGARSDNAHAILLDGVLYLNAPGITPLLAGGHPWLRVSLAGLQGLTGVNAAGLAGSLMVAGPATLTRMLAASTDLTDDGHESVDGVRTTHLRGTVTLSTALDQLSGSTRSQAEAVFHSSGTVGFDTWIDSSDLPRKIAFRVTGSDTPTSTTVRFHYGTSVRVSPPPPDEVGGF
jgi:hypothetical protein